MNRRENLKLIALGTGAATLPGLALAAQPAPPLIYDSRFAATRARAQGVQAHDCAHDAAQLWFARFARQPLPPGGIAGFTTQADSLILADLARREGFRMRLTGTAPDPSGLVRWHITA